MDWIYILAFIILGLVLIAVEIIFIPGTTVVGIIGFVTTVGGIAYGYKMYGTATGHAILGGTIGIGGVMTYLCFKLEVWRMFALNESINERVESNIKTHLFVGQEGISVSALRPMGTASFMNEDCEVKTSGEYIEAHQKIKIIKLEHNTIIVEPFN